MDGAAPNYMDMSLDEVIRDMKSRQNLALEVEDDNSPFLRKLKGPNFQRRPPFAKKQFRPMNKFTPRAYGNQNRSNYFNHLARKRVKAAHNTLDLRRKLIRLRATREGLDLRWQLVANMIAKMRQQASEGRAPNHSHRFHPYAALNRIPGANAGGGMASNLRISRPMVNRLERLVGKLPQWFAPKRMMAPPAPRLAPQPQQQYFHQHPCQAMEPPVMPYFQPGPSMAHSAPSHCSSRRSCCSSVCGDEMLPPPLAPAPPTYPTHHHHHHGHAQAQAYSSLPPPLEYQPPPARRPSTASQASHPPSIFSDPGNDEIIEVHQVDDDVQVPAAAQAVRMTLNERFSGGSY